MTENDEGPQGKSLAQRRRYWSIWHVAIVVAVFSVAIAVFRYSGDSDVVLAVGSGAGAGLIGWLFAYLHLRQPRAR